MVPQPTLVRGRAAAGDETGDALASKTNAAENRWNP
jgi:hypothetical protein